MKRKCTCLRLSVLTPILRVSDANSIIHHVQPPCLGERDDSKARFRALLQKQEWDRNALGEKLRLEKQALLEAGDLKTRAEVLTALAEMELAGNEAGGGSTLQ